MAHTIHIWLGGSQGSTKASESGLSYYDPKKKFYTPVPYFYADYDKEDSQWNRLLSFSDELGFLVVNPANGAGAQASGKWTNQLKQARALGAKILGYTSTNVATTSAEDIKAEVEKYQSFYGIDGVFLDETITGDSRSVAKIPYYEELYKYFKKKYGESFIVVANPGTQIRENVINTADVFMTFEGSGQKYIDTFDKVNVKNYANYPKQKFWHVVYDLLPEQQDKVNELFNKAHIGWYSATDDSFVNNEKNPFNNLPSREIIEKQVNAVSRRNERLDKLEARVKALEEKGS